MPKKKKRGRGRPKGSKKKFVGIPHNYYFWLWVIKNPNQYNKFKEKGTTQQKYELKQAEKHYKLTHREK